MQMRKHELRAEKDRKGVYSAGNGERMLRCADSEMGKVLKSERSGECFSREAGGIQQREKKGRESGRFSAQGASTFP
jgi:hypothetical protein